jgi:exonuclease III
MKVLSWNIRGINAPSKNMILRKRINQYNSSIVMLQETKCDRETMIIIARKVWRNCDVTLVEANGVVSPRLSPVTDHDIYAMNCKYVL